jgi:single stranded DNA-binding protein
MRIPYKNSVVFAGFIGNEVEARALGSGDAVCSIRIASKHSWKDATQGWKESTEWATAVFYRQDASDVAEACNKGDFIHVEGRKFSREWEDSAKVKRRSEEIIVTSWHKVDITAAGHRLAPTPPADTAANPTTKTAKPTASRRQQAKSKDYNYSRDNGGR